MLAKELLESNESCLRIVDSQQLVVGENRPFRFDRIFPQDSTQVNMSFHLQFVEFVVASFTPFRVIPNAVFTSYT